MDDKPSLGTPLPLPADTAVSTWTSPDSAEVHRFEAQPSRDEPPSDATPEICEDWNCPQCREVVPGSFAVCWNCGSDRQGKRDSELVNEACDPVAIDVSKFKPVEQLRSKPAVKRHCAACGSSKIIPNAKILDDGQYHTRGELCVVVLGDPDALIFKDRHYGTLTATICSECGHVQLHVANAGELYEHYLRSKQ
jgi:hypothetical protein